MTSSNRRPVTLLLMLLSAMGILCAQTRDGGVISADGVATAEVNRRILIVADQSVFSLRLPRTVSLAQTLTVHRHVDLKLEEFEGLDASAYLFRQIVPAHLQEERIAGLLNVGGGGFRVSPSVSQNAIERARISVWPALYAQGRSLAESMLREAGFQPGSLAAIAERHTVNPLSGVVEIALSVSVRRLAPGPTEPSVAVLVPVVGQAAAGDRFRVTANFSTGLGFPRAHLLEFLQKEGLSAFELSGFDSPPDNRPDFKRLVYRFTMTAAAGELAAITDAVQRVPRGLRGTSVESVGTMRVLGLPGNAAVIHEGRRQAELLAQAIGFRLGAAQSLRAAGAGADRVIGFITGSFGLSLIPAERVTVLPAPASRTLRESPADSIQVEFALLTPQ